MSVRVNLLPEATRVRERQSQQRLLVLGAFVLLLLVIAGGYWFQLQRVSDAEAELQAVDARVAERERELAQLAPFEQLEASLAQANQALVNALGDEISLAGVLQDLALVTPGDVALTDIDYVVTEDIPTADGPVIRSAISRLVVSGETTTDHAPGLERMMLQYDKIASLFNVHLASTEIDSEQPDVLLFTIEADLGDEARTLRYVDGVPEGLR